jgi:hypothetical protein
MDAKRMPSWAGDAAIAAVPIVALAFLLLPVTVRADGQASRRDAATAAGPRAHQSAFPAPTYISRRDLAPPKVTVTKRARRLSPGYIFLTSRSTVGGQGGPLIVDNRGRVIWFEPRPGRPSNLHVIEFRGRPHLAWWEGRSFGGYGRGEWIVVDRSYREVARIRAGNGVEADFHDVVVTGNTAIMISYVAVMKDLSAIGGAPNTGVLDNVVQEVDLRTGRVLFQWSALDHIDFSESYRPPPRQAGQPYDYLHVNALDVDDDGNLLISCRRTNSVIKVDRKTGAVMWRLGGKRSTFKLAQGADFKLQHDADRQADGSISIFDNGEDRGYKASRGISLRLDTKTMTAKLRRSNRNPVSKLSSSQGNFQSLSHGHFFAGWGSLPNFTEFSRTGKVLFNATLPDKVNSYRAYRFRWSGRPATKPALVVRHRSKGGYRLNVSWNGATNVRSWRVLAGSSPSRLRTVRYERRAGFETKIDLRTSRRYFAVQAISPHRRTLGTSKTVTP